MQAASNMTVQKFIKYNSLDINGQVLNDEHNLELNVLEKSGNYLVHKDILRHQISKKQGTTSTKTTLRSPKNYSKKIFQSIFGTKIFLKL